jgi:hypothetical protein
MNPTEMPGTTMNQYYMYMHISIELRNGKSERTGMPGCCEKGNVVKKKTEKEKRKEK